MRRILSLIALFGVAVCNLTPAAGEEIVIGDRQSFMEIVEGKCLVSPGATVVVVNADGTLDFKRPDMDHWLSGTWSWHEGRFCRFLDKGAVVALTACQIVTLEGQTLTFSGHDGARSYRLQCDKDEEGPNT